LREDSVLTGPLEPTNEPYAIAKIAGIKLAEAYRNQYGSEFISVMRQSLRTRRQLSSRIQPRVAALIRRFMRQSCPALPSRGLGHRHRCGSFSMSRISPTHAFI